MANLATNLLRQSGRFILANSACGKNSAAPLSNLLHTSSAQDYSHLTRNSDGKFNCTLIPGDGVGPELVNNLMF